MPPEMRVSFSPDGAQETQIEGERLLLFSAQTVQRGPRPAPLCSL